MWLLEGIWLDRRRTKGVSEVSGKRCPFEMAGFAAGNQVGPGASLCGREQCELWDSSYSCCGLYRVALVKDAIEDGLARLRGTVRDGLEQIARAIKER